MSFSLSEDDLCSVYTYQTRWVTGKVPLWKPSLYLVQEDPKLKPELSGKTLDIVTKQNPQETVHLNTMENPPSRITNQWETDDLENWSLAREEIKGVNQCFKTPCQHEKTSPLVHVRKHKKGTTTKYLHITRSNLSYTQSLCGRKHELGTAIDKQSSG